MRVATTVFDFFPDDARTLPCTAFYPADTNCTAPVVLCVTGDAALSYMVELQLRRMASCGYLGLLIYDAPNPEREARGFERVVTQTRMIVSRISVSASALPVRPGDGICLAGGSEATAAMLALAGVPVVRNDGFRGVFDIPEVKAMILFDPSLNEENAARLDLTSDPKAPLLMIHAVGIQNGIAEARARQARVYRVGKGYRQYALDRIFYQRQLDSEYEANAFFWQDAESSIAAFLDAYLRGSHAAKVFLGEGTPRSPLYYGRNGGDVSGKP
jgi:hypothetical protein